MHYPETITIELFANCTLLTRQGASFLYCGCITWIAKGFEGKLANPVILMITLKDVSLNHQSGVSGISGMEWWNGLLGQDLCACI